MLGPLLCSVLLGLSRISVNMASINDKLQQAAPRNQELLLILAETDHAKPSLEQQNRYIAMLEDEVKQVDKQIVKLEQKRKLELKDHEKYSSSVMKRFAYKVGRKEAKFNEKASKEEKEYFDALQEEHKSKVMRETLGTNLSDAQKVKVDLDAVSARHKKAQQDLDDLYDSIFEGPTPGYPEEDAQEQAAHDALNQYHDARVRLETETQVLTLLGNAGARMTESQKQLAVARSHSQMDMFGGGAMSDMMERNALSRAEMALMQAKMEVERAQILSSDVHPMPAVHIAQGNLMSDVLFDNIFTDMAFHEKIKAAQAEQETAHRDLDAQFLNSKQRLANMNDHLKMLAENLGNARVGLQRVRQDAFTRVQS